MLDVVTRDITWEEIEQFISNARRVSSFKAIKKGPSSLSLIQRHLPDLSSYDIRPFPKISMKFEGQFLGPETGTAFWRLAERLKPICVSTVGRLEIAESDQCYNVNESSDIQLTFGFDFIGPTTGVAVGAASPGIVDLSYRQRVFDDFLRILGLKGRLEMVIDDSGLDIQIRDTNFQFSDSIAHRDLPAAYTSGVRLIHKGVTNTQMKNPCGIELNAFNLQELPGLVSSLVDFYSEAKIKGSLFWVACDKEAYQQVRDTLNESSFGPWRLGFTANCKYDLSTLDKAMGDCDRFGFPAFTLNPKGVGEVAVDLYYEKNMFVLHLQTEYKSNAQEQALHQLIIGLAGGKDIIDHTPR